MLVIEFNEGSISVFFFDRGLPVRIDGKRRLRVLIGAIAIIPSCFLPYGSLSNDGRCLVERSMILTFFMETLAILAADSAVPRFFSDSRVLTDCSCLLLSFVVLRLRDYLRLSLSFWVVAFFEKTELRKVGEVVFSRRKIILGFSFSRSLMPGLTGD